MDKIILANFTPLDIAEFWMHVKKICSETSFHKRAGPCWEWKGPFFNSGYGHFINHTKSYRAHRVAYFLYNGNISNKLFICHTCDNTKCVNPKHLYEGTASENIKDRERRNRGRPPTGLRKNKTSSIYHGVFFDKSTNVTKMWRALYTFEGKTYRIGRYRTEIEAAKAYDDAIKKLNENLPDGKKRKLNFT